MRATALAGNGGTGMSPVRQSLRLNPARREGATRSYEVPTWRRRTAVRTNWESVRCATVRSRFGSGVEGGSSCVTCGLPGPKISFSPVFGYWRPIAALTPAATSSAATHVRRRRRLGEDNSLLTRRMVLLAGVDVRGRPAPSVSGLHGYRGQREGDPGAPALAGLRPDLAAVRLDEPACYREAQTGARLSGRARAVCAPEPIEHAARRLGGDSLARVLDAHPHLVRVRRENDGDRTVRRRVPQRVREQVREHALDLLRRARHLG